MDPARPHPDRPARGRLRVHLGAAPGVGKTVAMLEEAHRRAARGADLVAALVETHGRPLTAARLEGLEVVPRRVVEHRGLRVAELDVDAVLRRRPQVALVDELAHTNAAGSRNAKRWQDVAELLDAGIDVVSTVNVQHLESLNDVVRAVTGVEQRETLPDDVLRRADQVQLVDVTPEALQRRISRGDVYRADRIDAALANYFRLGNLTALRELALLWLADRVEEGLERYRAQQGIRAPWPTRERVVVALTGGPEGATLVRRAARATARGAGGELHAVHVARADGLLRSSPARLAAQRTLVEDLGGTYHQVVGEDVAASLLAFARGVNASRLVVGASRHGRLAGLFRAGVGDAVVRGSGAVDVLVVTHEAQPGAVRLPRPARAALSGTRRALGWVVAVLGTAVTTAVLLALPRQDLATDLLAFLVLVVAAALAGGVLPAVVAALLGGLAVNYFFTAPLHQLAVAQPANAVALGVFLLVALAVSTTVDRSARRSREAARSRAESEALSVLTRTALRAEHPLDGALEHTRETFAVDSVTLLERAADDAPWRPVAAAGDAARPGEGEAEVVSEDGTSRLVLRGRLLGAGDRRVLEAFAGQVVALRQRQRLSAEAAQVRRLEEGDAVRGALLTAVSHDLRTPLATLGASLDSLRDPELDLPADLRRELLDTAADSADRLQALIDDLLDLTRVRSGQVEPRLVATGLDEVVDGVLAGLDADHDRVRVHVPRDLPAAATDPGLLRRVVANLVQNALRHGGGDVRVDGLLAVDGGHRRLQLRVVDHGPGLPGAAKDRAFTPFQRLGDRSGAGLGLGLAVARGLAEAVGGRLAAEDTPGGGLTMVLDLPPAPPHPHAPDLAADGARR